MVPSPSESVAYGRAEGVPSAELSDKIELLEALPQKGSLPTPPLFVSSDLTGMGWGIKYEAMYVLFHRLIRPPWGSDESQPGTRDTQISCSQDLRKRSG